MAIVQPLKCYKYTRALHFNFCEIIRFYGGWQLLLHVAIGNRRIIIFTKYVIKCNQMHMSKKKIIIKVLSVLYGWLWENVQESLTDKNSMYMYIAEAH